MSSQSSQRTNKSLPTSLMDVKPMSTVESSVTKLLISTKSLLEKLKQWSKRLATEEQVSDSFVQLGNDFKLVSKHFLHAGLDVVDLGDVPMELRLILERALSEPATEETINKYLPQIREIIVNLLDKLKGKQQQLKQRKNEQRTSAGSTRSIPPSSRFGEGRGSVPNSNGSSGVVNEVPRTVTDSRSHSVPNASTIDDPVANDVKYSTVDRQSSKQSNNVQNDEDPLSQLKNGNTLQRRASKRFSAYHMAKLTHISNADTPTPVLPTSAEFSMKSQPNTRGTTNKHIELATHNSDDEGEVTESTNRPSRYIGDGSTVTVFLKLNNRVKKCTATLPLTFNQIRLLFVEKFTYSPGGDSFPDIYIKEPGHDVAYELEESQLHFIKDDTVLQLQLDSLSPTQADWSKKLEEFKAEVLDSQRAMFNELKNLVMANDRASSGSPLSLTSGVPQQNVAEQVRSIKHDLSILSQAHNNSNQTLKNTITTMLEKVKKFQSLNLNASSPANRVYMEQSHTKLSELSDTLLAKVDDLQDIIEALRKDVAIRGAKPSRKKLESVQQELKNANADLERMEEYLEIEKPNWKKIWEFELDKVCEEQQFLTLQEDLVFDLKEDLNKANETFELVELCCQEQEKNPKRTRAGPILPLARPSAYSELRNRVLMEVEKLNPDHVSRLQAIERAEKLREKELQYRDGSAFESELEDFIEKGNFKRAGGIEEIERHRKERDEQNLRETFGSGML
ncbi:HER223Wp [Eremothecium sinecaudum]|uniref:HER223Wp n=1 Tax=Eremothecium sinecaudum TaxID=45286 RepID=A0A0X8HU59_9SACH|nr:HER223Wp [Eremothecium sinecaudum]AMD21501.1 HER223Wp [Eremothecium sinecaudum]